MTQKECYQKLLREYPDKVAKKVILYHNHFVYLLVPKDNPDAMAFDQFFAVDKDNGTISSYQPTNDKNADDFFKKWSGEE